METSKRPTQDLSWTKMLREDGEENRIQKHVVGCRGDTKPTRKNAAEEGLLESIVQILEAGKYQYQ